VARRPADLAEMRRRYAAEIARAAGVHSPRVEEVFATVPREDFLPPGPWTTISSGLAERASTADPRHIYQNVLVALDRKTGINNGEPALHFAWLAAVDPKPGEAVVHVGAGMGYYTAMLARLVAPGGRVDAFEVESHLADAAARNLAGEGNVTVHGASAFGRELPPADVVYVNAGVLAPDAEWLKAVKPGGRLIFPWQPTKYWGHTMLVTRRGRAFSAIPTTSVGFIPCTGETTRKNERSYPGEGEIAGTRSVWLTADRAPDENATAVYDAVWFSREEVA
jgi:protein-L-isoaspartate(D-aspartate) O-methyltransferase